MSNVAFSSFESYRCRRSDFVNPQRMVRSFATCEDVKKQGAANCHVLSRHDHLVAGVWATEANDGYLIDGLLGLSQEHF